ncbi:MAG: zinc-binding dehydrogenase [Deltaproteobacteria bacterium]|nr:zinc-binding dehydrogenase [Deltaproteobacteria bacterium]
MSQTILQNMKALVLTGPGKFEIQEVPVPTPGPFEVLCRIGAVAICGTDPEVIKGSMAGYWPPSYPFIPGHEWAGEVVALGENAEPFFKIGDRVAGEAWKGCGHCANCVAGHYNRCQNYGRLETGIRHYGFQFRGAYAQYNVYSVKSIHKMGDSVSFREGSLVDTAGVGLHGMELTGITPGGTVAIIGPGPIGILAMRTARLLGAAKFIVVGRPPRLDAAGKLGADILINIQREDPVEGVRTANGGFGVDEAFECSGSEGTLYQAIRMVREGGRIGLLGVPHDKVMEKIPFKYVCRNEIAIFGSKANPNVSDKVLSLMASGQLVVKDLITHVFPLEEFAQALKTFVHRKDGAMKVVIEPNGPEKDIIPA